VRDDEVFLLRKQIKMINRRLQREIPQIGGLSLTAIQLLLALDRAGQPLRPGKLAKDLEMSQSNVATALRALEASDRVHLNADPDDGRKSFVHLTKRAAGEVKSFRQAYNSWFRAVVEEVLNEREQRLLVEAGALMERIALHADRG
jgi:DNA-binding MarR family transcriptional regulator